jgi:SAM-dependent methyltransferase
LKPSDFIELQRKAFQQCEWGPDGALPYAMRRDNTFGQLSSNILLIRLEKFVATLKHKAAVTICDGRGVEASYLKNSGLTVTATDLNPRLLAGMKDKGLIDDFHEENAERLSFPDDHFDWGMVKAGLHHLPRPWLGLYELLRVSREGVILIEGYDGLALRLARRWFSPHRDWEPSGNYVFRFQPREIEKICLSLSLPAFTFQTCFMPWARGQEKIPKGSLGYNARLIFYNLLNLLISKLGNNLAVVIFKHSPDDGQLLALAASGFQSRLLPMNPNLKTKPE